MLFTPISRDDLLRFLPKGGVVAEIGVALGEFSTIILETAAPERLHLIDPWHYQDPEEYRGDPNNVSDAQNEVRFQEVIEKVTKDIESGRVVVHRKFSGEAVQSFEDESLDWI